MMPVKKTQKVFVMMIYNEQVTSYELWVNILTSYIYCTSYELRFIFTAQVTNYFLHTSYEFLFIAWVSSCCTYELWVTVYSISYELLLLHKIRLIVCCASYELLFIAQVTSYILTMSYNKNRDDDEAAYDNKVW